MAFRRWVRRTSSNSVTSITPELSSFPSSSTLITWRHTGERLKQEHLSRQKLTLPSSLSIARFNNTSQDENISALTNPHNIYNMEFISWGGWSDQEACWTTSHSEETPGQTQNSPEGLNIFSGLGTLWSPPGGAGPVASTTQPQTKGRRWRFNSSLKIIV